MALIVCGRFFMEDAFWVESGGLLKPTLRDNKRHTGVHKGPEVLGWACRATPQAPVLFKTRALYALLPWEGQGWSVIFCSAGGLPHCKPT